ncbi:Rv1535 family protein [Mycobacterium intracellulare]|uniref:Rv1535 family protein n=1 Tax=Mycobacterium intracellulare TaxID=1767 RepID=UPI00044981C5|nr:Rv1535 family protein [Mycobacterium intracellulare]AOS92608.1 hypothetical protein AN480_16025 [Mycobacterium intracellulare subsp. chimaera]ARV82910.1 hypothetical protein BWK49_17630 [Mycobacterium intracellulare subsp. chimaera]ASL10101.1 hypothetical protein MYCODSM44623_03394 [Mycobacterium intracellulare subsp. chimaera]ASL22002.1 hypothetical protein MYCOZU1_03603 [Mycobacterium intracellulare subsp. chimaera]ETZ29527.1 hypothetical protein L842_3222 [Mycobacterium intracellulare MI
MTAALYDDVVTVAPARTLRVVRDVPEIHVPEPMEELEEPRRSDFPLFGPGGDPLIHGACRLLSIPLRHVYAALWRVGVLEVRGQ